MTTHIDAPATSPPAPQNGHAPAKPVRRQHTPTPRPVGGGIIGSVIVLAVVLVGIIGVAFRGSWTAHRDGALAAHFDATGAALYPFAPDGLILIALIAAMLLRHDQRARLYALTVVGVFTLSSFVVNHLHGLGSFTPDPVSGLRPELPWPVVGLIAGQVIGAMFFGSHLIVYALRYLFPGTQDDQREHASEGVPGEAFEQAPVQPVETVREVPVDPDPEQIAALVYGAMLDLGQSIGRDRLAKACGISVRVAIRVRRDVDAAREEAALAAEEEARAAELAQADPAHGPNAGDPEETQQRVFAVNGSAPVGA